MEKAANTALRNAALRVESLGVKAHNSGHFTTAIACHRLALIPLRKPGAESLHAGVSANLESSLTQGGIKLSERQQADRAIPLLERSLALHQLNVVEGRKCAVGLRDILIQLGLCHAACSRQDRAANFFRQSLSLIQDQGEEARELYVLARLSEALATLTRRTPSEDVRDEAISVYGALYQLAVELGDEQVQAASLRGHGYLLFDSGDRSPETGTFLSEAIAKVTELAASDERLGHEATRLRIWLGKYFIDRGEPARALPILDLATEASKDLKDLRGCSCRPSSLGYMVRALEDLHDFALAERYVREALDHAHETNNEADAIIERARLGTVISAGGSIEAGLAEVEAALAASETLRQRQPGRVGEWAFGKVLSSLSILHNNLTKQYGTAAATMRASAAIAKQLGDVRLAAERYLKLGISLGNNRETGPSINALEEALALCKQLAAPHIETRTHVLLAERFLSTSDTAGAIEHFQAAADIHRAQSEFPRLSAVIRSMASAPGLSPGEAVTYLSQAAAISSRTGNTAEEATTMRELARLRRITGLREEAATHYKRGIEIVESVRGKLGDPAERAAVLEAHASLYADAATYAVEKSEASRAFQYVEAGRARLTLDRRVEEAAGQIQDPQLRERRQALGEEIRAHLRQLERLGIDWLRSTGAAPSVSQTEDGATVEIVATEAKLRDLEASWHSLERSLAEQNPRFAARIQSNLDSIWTVTMVQDNLLSDDSVLLEYLTTDDACLLFCISKSTYQVFNLAYDRPELEVMVDEMCDAIDNVANGYPHGHTLYSALIEPAEKIIAGKSEILISPDGCLHRLPFAALLTEDPGEDPDTPPDKRPDFAYRWGELPYFLGDSMQIRYIASATTEGMLRAAERSEQPAFQDQLLALGAPLADLDGARPADLDPLPFVTEELDKISRAFANGVVSLPSAEGNLPATRDSALELLDGKSSLFRYVHFATHARLDDRRPWHSALVFEPDVNGQAPGYMLASEAADLDVPSLCVTMSGCRTLGRHVTAGEGVVGLALAFRHAGARNVCASMWPVFDKSTATLMSEFYRHLEADMLPPAAALALAQRNLIRRGYHPHNWAAFGIFG